MASSLTKTQRKFLQEASEIHIDLIDLILEVHGKQDVGITSTDANAIVNANHAKLQDIIKRLNEKVLNPTGQAIDDFEIRTVSKSIQIKGLDPVIDDEETVAVEAMKTEENEERNSNE